MLKSILYASALIAIGIELAKRYPKLPQPSMLIRSGRKRAEAAQKTAQGAAAVATNEVAQVQDDLEAERQKLSKRLSEVNLGAAPQS